ncbi:MAG: aminotransferase class V-fold PLP-dependent enzyme [Candidatus Omnitrophica bacterium]|nr:aminotransferase class V-fold PLP-dependent enzyme [Candidatus Omnitrophota bacterium]
MGKKTAISGGEKVREEPFITVPIIGREEKEQVNEVIDNGILSGFVANAGEQFYGGKKVREFERLFAEHFKIKNAIAVNSATAGLHAALAAAEIGPGDEVIVPPYTMSASATAILMQNAIPVFADIDDRTFCADPASIEKKITSRTRAIIVVHLFGQCADMDPIIDMAKKNDLFVIEDCAQSPGATYKGRAAGTMGDIGVFSLNQHKIISCGEGGVVTTDNDDLARNVRLVRNHGEVVVDKLGLEEIPPIVGWNYRMTELEAAVSIAQFKKLEKLTAERKKLASYLTDKLSGFEELNVPYIPEDNTHVFFVYPITLNLNKLKISRSQFTAALRAEGIPCGEGYVRPIYLEPTYREQKAYGVQGCPYKCPLYGKEISYSEGDCPVTENMHYERLFVLPVCRAPQTEKDIDDVVSAFEKILYSQDDLAGIDV